MSAALGLLLIGQLNSFEFSPISSPQFAGDSFAITIVAKNPSGAIYPYNGTALLATNRDDFWNYVSPTLITFQQGVFTGFVTVTIAAESLRLKCTEPSRNVLGWSNWFRVISGAPDRMLVILPGEQMAPGSPAGRLPLQPSSHVAGEQFDFRVYLTDKWFNPVGFRTDSVYFGCSDVFAVLPPGGVLSNGGGVFSATARAAGAQRIVARPSVLQSFRPDTSTAFVVVPGPFDNLLLVLPGETPLPGDDTTDPWLTPGKSGSPDAQYVHDPFPAVVYSCDRCWNRVPAPNLSVRLHSDFRFASVPTETTLTDSAVFAADFGAPGPNQNIWVTGEPGGYVSYRTQLNVRARGQRLEVTAPDTVRAGETTAIHVIVRDANGEPITATVCRFAVVKGHGDMLQTALLTDTLGLVTGQFLCTRARFGEHDTIRITSGNADTLIGIYVNIPDSAVMKGEIIAVPNPFGYNRDAVEVHYYLQRSSPISVTIYDPFGNEVVAWRFAQNDPGAKSGQNTILWNGRNARGRRVASGVYVIHVLGELHTGTTFNKTHRIGVVW